MSVVSGQWSNVILRNLTVPQDDLVVGSMSTLVMANFSHNPVYNARNPPMPISVGVSRAALRSLLLLSAGIAFASDWQAPASQLAQRIAGITGPGAVAVSVINRSSLSPSDTDDVRRKLLSELAAFGVQSAASDQAAATVQVSLSENLQGYLWVAEIHQGTSEPVTVMVIVPGSSKASEDRSAPLSIHKSLLWSDENRILDVAVINGNPSHMIVLEGERIGLYRWQNSQWQQDQLLAVVHVRPWPRDLRGRLILRKDHLFDAYLPGVYCRSTATAPLSVTCDDSDDPWPLTGNPGELNAFFSASRNFFTGALSPGIQKQKIAPAFYSAAALPRDKYTLWAFAAVDGQVHFLDGVGDQAFAQLGWGSDIASVRSGCGPGWQILATSNEAGPTDEVRAFEVADREPILVSAPVQFNGAITALWADADSTSLTAITRSAETGNYEAYRLTIDCHQ
jgi:hypothetical protein